MSLPRFDLLWSEPTSGSPSSVYLPFLGSHVKRRNLLFEGVLKLKFFVLFHLRPPSKSRSLTLARVYSKALQMQRCIETFSGGEIGFCGAAAGKGVNHGEEGRSAGSGRVAEALRRPALVFPCAAS